MVKNQHPTLDDVAHRADVSLATASRVLNGSNDRSVGEKLRNRVLSATEELGYIPNAHAQALAGAATSTVGVITHDVSDPYFSALARGAMRVATEHSLLVMLASTFRDPEREIAYVSTLRSQRARALLLIGSGFEDPTYTQAMQAELTPYRKAGGSIAMVSHHNLPIDAVVPNNRAGAAKMAETLYDLGHRRFAIIHGPQMLTTVAHRFAGFTEALAQRGIEVDPNTIVDGAFTRDGGYDAALELVRRGLPASAIFCLNDVMAVGASAALREQGYTVPDDVSLAGFDDIEIVRDITPPLTTLRLPLEDIGARAMEMALEEGETRDPRVEHVDGQVVLRDSTTSPRT